MKIRSLHALEILDSRGNPTVRTLIELEDGSLHSSSVPSGASTGTHEAVELRDKDPNRYSGVGVLTAVEHVNTTLNAALQGMNVTDPRKIDEKMLYIDGTENKKKLGANAILSVSQAVIRASAYSHKKKLWEFINEYYFKGIKPSFPGLMVNIINGGKHADWTFDIQEFMVLPASHTPSTALQTAVEIFHSLGKLLKEKKFSVLLGDEGGYSPSLSSNEEVIQTIIDAAKQVNFEHGADYNIGLDAAASEWLKNGKYISHQTNKQMTQKQLIDMYLKFYRDYHVYSFEDIFAEDDWESWVKITGLLKNALVVGDDLFTTNTKRIEKGIKLHAANAVLVKVNQIGTVLETVEAINMTRKAYWKVIISHRSGETEDTFIADLAYACAADFLKTGSTARSERLAKYNRLLEIEKGF